MNGSGSLTVTVQLVGIHLFLQTTTNHAAEHSTEETILLWTSSPRAITNSGAYYHEPKAAIRPMR